MYQETLSRKQASDTDASLSSAFAGVFEDQHFDSNLDKLMEIVHELIMKKGVFHINIHFSSSQLVCWTLDNPFSFQIYTADEVFSSGFMRLFSPLESKLHTCIGKDQVRAILESLKWLRGKREGSELRNASIHMINGYIGLGFSCDDTRYINFKHLNIPAAHK